MSLTVDIKKKLKDMTLDVSFTTENIHGITGILGASGCGKSMTLKCIAGIETPDRGKIVLNGRVLFDAEKKVNVKIQDRKVGYLFQHYALFPHMTVLQNVELAMYSGCSRSKKEKRQKAMEYLRMFAVEELAGHSPARLSGGQQQRVALARIMASSPDVLMLDEPFSALDAYLKESLELELMEELKHYKGDVLLVTHNRDEIYRLCDYIHVLEAGVLAGSGSVKEVFQNPGTVAAARLTGCKNIVKAEPVNSHQLYVPAWDACLFIRNRDIPSDCSHIGIRAHYLKIAQNRGEENTLPCSLNRLIEDPFEMTLILDNGIWWKIPKETWAAVFDGTVLQWVTVPEESIFFLKDEEKETEL